jgi:hypothetical protein
VCWTERLQEADSRLLLNSKSQPSCELCSARSCAIYNLYIATSCLLLLVCKQLPVVVASSSTTHRWYCPLYMNGPLGSCRDIQRH